MGAYLVCAGSRASNKHTTSKHFISVLKFVQVVLVWLWVVLVMLCNMNDVSVMSPPKPIPGAFKNNDRTIKMNSRTYLDPLLLLQCLNPEHANMICVRTSGRSCNKIQGAQKRYERLIRHKVKIVADLVCASSRAYKNHIAFQASHVCPGFCSGGPMCVQVVPVPLLCVIRTAQNHYQHQSHNQDYPNHPREFSNVRRDQHKTASIKKSGPETCEQPCMYIRTDISDTRGSVEGGLYIQPRRNIRERQFAYRSLPPNLVYYGKGLT